MSTASTTRATLDDLMSVDGKAELINGRIVLLMPAGDLPTDVANEIYVSLRSHTKATKIGKAKADGVGYAIPELPSGRESFSPVASYYDGPPPADRMRFIQGPPTFAVEVRNENDYGSAKEAEIAAERVDYFAAGTLVVWDVDPKAETVTCYRKDDAANPTVYRRDDNALAEPAVPGWTMSVDDIFDL